MEWQQSGRCLELFELGEGSNPISPILFSLEITGVVEYNLSCLKKTNEKLCDEEEIIIN